MAFTDKTFKKIKYANDVIFAFGEKTFIGYEDVLGNGMEVPVYGTPILYKKSGEDWIDGGLIQIPVPSRNQYNPINYDVPNLIVPVPNLEDSSNSYRLVGDFIDKTVNIYDLTLSDTVQVSTKLLSISSNIYAENYGSTENNTIVITSQPNANYGHNGCVVIEPNLTNIAIRNELFNSDYVYRKILYDGSGVLYELTVTSTSNYLDNRIKRRDATDFVRVLSQTSIEDVWESNEYDPSYYDFTLLRDGRILLVNGGRREYVIYNSDLTIYKSPSYIVPETPDQSWGRYRLIQNDLTYETFLFWFGENDSSWTVYKFDNVTLEWDVYSQSTPIPAINPTASGYVNGFYYISRAGAQTFISTDMSNWSVLNDYGYLSTFNTSNLSYFNGYYYRVGRGPDSALKLLRSADITNWELSPINDIITTIRNCYVAADNLYILSIDTDNLIKLYKISSSDMNTPVSIFPQVLYEYNDEIKLYYGSKFLIANPFGEREHYYINTELSIEQNIIPKFLYGNRLVKQSNLLLDLNDLESNTFYVCNADYQFSSMRAVPNPVSQTGLTIPTINETPKYDILYDGARFIFVLVYNNTESIKTPKYIFVATSEELNETTQWTQVCNQPLLAANGDLYACSFNGSSYIILLDDNTLFASKDCVDWYNIELVSDDADNTTWYPIVLKEQFPGLTCSNDFNDTEPDFNFRYDSPPYFFGDVIWYNSSVVIRNPRSYVNSSSPASYSRLSDAYKYMSGKYRVVSVFDDFAIFQYASTQERSLKLLFTDGIAFYNINDSTFNFVENAKVAGFENVATNGNSAVILLKQFDADDNLIDFRLLYVEKMNDSVVIKWTIRNDNRLYGIITSLQNITTTFTEDSIIFDLEQIYVIDRFTGNVDSSNTGNIIYSPGTNSELVKCTTTEPFITAIGYPYIYFYNSETFEYVGSNISENLTLGSEDIIESYYYDSNNNIYIIAVYTSSDSYLIYKSSNLTDFEQLSELSSLFTVPTEKNFYDYSCTKFDIITGECRIKSDISDAGTYVLQYMYPYFSIYKMRDFNIIRVELYVNYYSELNDNYSRTDNQVRYYYTTNWTNFFELNLPPNYNPMMSSISDYCTDGKSILDIDANKNNNKFSVGISYGNLSGGEGNNPV